ncbi:MAG: DmsC/YnfH family molybdoenzyme membrane anchor subunit [Pseudoruegeria sp.]
MHPAPSVILFTVLSGLGFGLLTFLGLGLPDVSGWVAFFFFFLGYALAVGGLLASTFHLGNRKNAIKSFSQWRSSWLSREAWLSVLALCFSGLYAASLIFLGIRIPLIGALGAVLCVATVLSTSMIYTQLTTIPRWNHWSTPILFLALSLGGGALLASQITLAGILLAFVGILQAWVWWDGDQRFARAGSNIGTATGLGDRGDVRLFEAPHTGTNYLLTEMVYVVGRKHADKLRMIALACMSIFPALILLFLPVGHVLALIVVVLHIGGVMAARWLFFAEAEHVVGLYYDKR